MTDYEKIQYLYIAKRATLLAGELLKKDEPGNRKVIKELIHDVKIEADVKSEKLILDYLQRTSKFSILSEEKGLINGTNKDYIWIVDPLDGSLNYSRSIPLCCVSIGLWKGNIPILGAIYDFNRNELFSGIVDQGAWLNDKPIKVSKNEKKNSVICTGFPVRTDFSDENINAFIEQVKNYKKVRLLGSAALSIAYVACGRVDAYHEKDIMLWDVGGGIPIVFGAGGYVQWDINASAYCLTVNVDNAVDKVGERNKKG